MRLIDADELLTHIEDYGEGQSRLDLIDPYYVRNASTVDAISRKQIDEMIAEIRDYSNKHTTINVDTKKVVVEALLCIIHKYCDKEQIDGNDD